MTMTRDELLAKLNSVEWNDIEFKEATWAVPRDALTTVSAFANTTGGHLVFGVRQANDIFEIVGVTSVDEVQNGFLGQVRDRNKISVLLPIREQLHNLLEGKVLVFFVPEARRDEKPVFINGNPRKAYVRRGSRDDTCTPEEQVRFLRDGADVRYDKEPLPDLNIERCFDAPTVRWYRQRHAERIPGRYEQLSDTEFLQQMAAIAEQQGRLVPTRAGVLVFGTDAAFRQILSRPVVDFRVYRERKADYSADVRWADRLTPIPEENLIKTWQSIVNFYTGHSEHAFAIDPGSMRRVDDPPDYVSFREAVINLLIHQDFGEQTRWPTILFFKDQSEFYNPGDAFSTLEQLIDPGEKPVRNPSIVSLFRRIGLSDQAGSGVGAIFESWRRLGNTLPVIENEKVEKTFRLRLIREKLLTEAQLLAQADIGVRLSEQEAAVFAYLTRVGHVDLIDVKGLTGLNGQGALQLVQKLTVQALVEPPAENGNLYRLAAPFRDRFQGNRDSFVEHNQSGTEILSDGRSTVQGTVQVSKPSINAGVQLAQLTAIQWAIVNNAGAPRTLAQLRVASGLKQRAHFMTQHVAPLLQGGVLRMTLPDKPTSPKQRYVLTDAGIQIKTLLGQDAPSIAGEKHTK